MQEIRFRQLSVSQNRNWLDFYAKFLKSNHLFKIYKLVFFIMFLVMLCFVFARIPEIEKSNFDFLLEYLNFLLICFSVGAFFVFMVLPLAFSHFATVDVVFTESGIYREKKVRIGVEIPYSLLTKIVVVEELLIDIWFKNSFGVNNSIRLWGLNKAEVEKIVKLLKDKNNNLKIQDSFWIK